MKNLAYSTISIWGIALLALAMPALRAQDMVKVAPKYCKVLLENDRVRVVSVVVMPGEKMEMHSHPANIVYSFTATKAKITSPDGKAEEREIEADQAIWSEAVTHGTENSGTTGSRVLVIELKK